jgi:eukaryotic-like serine/threonine-protein kinase
VKVCPDCRYQFGDEHEFCPTHGKRLTQHTLQVKAAPAGPGATTIFFNPNAAQPEENYERYIGSVLDGRYVLEQKMGEGGMGVVFKARHTVIEKTVAVKILKREVARDRAVLQRFVQEAKAASRIGHWSIVDVTDFGTLPDGSAYQVMEFIDGETLGRAIRRGPMWAARAMPIAAQIARALGAAHEKGIVHRDLKPENIFLVEKNGRPDLVKIVDFGVAKFAPVGIMDGPRLTRAGAVFGTPEYMAPEQAAGRSDNDHRVDIYALGTILYELLVGRVPHKGDTVVATLAQQMLDPIIPPRRMNPRADVSERLEQVIMTALSKDRDRRYPSMADFWVGLEWAAVEQGIVLEPGGPTGSSMDMPLMATPRGLTVDGRRITERPETRHGPTLAPMMPGAAEAAMLDAAESPGLGRRIAFAALGVVGIAAVTLVLALVLRGGRQAGPPAPGQVAPALSAADADTALVIAAPDARPVALAAPGAGEPPVPGDPSQPADAQGDSEVAASGTLGADPGAPVAASALERPMPPDPSRPPVEIAVTTRPSGGSLYTSGLAAGKDGTRLARPRGTRLEVFCLFPGNDRWEPGRLLLHFDGQRASATCTMTRKTRCVKDLRNPFRDCPD